ncbi:hypothetical protein [Streptomyces resistomycificus]|uniref:Lipoprotein n=1 Tax=Streptomyces resistomycificus TaxID=67356 RepID=A0A0L8L3R8_9ACTN|nr:hypothetical protein [Streptomyces resistomycificus]KOG32729.1 lipoprotein [Streptomyces resistomycificus]KUN92167.1 hypothetical protein AQJ84_34690 [Streptomyces resistomycificus]
MKRSSGARLSATAAVSVLSLALITGCSDEGSEDSAKSGSSSSPTAAAKAYSAAELEKLLLADGDIEGYKVTSGDDTLPKSKSVLKIDKAECEPFAHAMAALPPGDTDASASNTVTQAAPSGDASKSLEDLAEGDFSDAFNINATYVGLSSYEGDGAEKAFKAVSDGGTACAGGFGYTAEGTATKVTKITPEKASGAGDESVAYTVESEAGGETGTVHTEVVRHGNTIASYYTVNLALMGTGKPYDVPAEVIDGQAAKLK